MSSSKSISDVEDRFENKFATVCDGRVERVSITTLGTLRVHILDAKMYDLDVIDEVVGVNSVERRGGCLEVTSEEQVAPCR